MIQTDNNSNTHMRTVKIVTTTIATTPARLAWTTIKVRKGNAMKRNMNGTKKKVEQSHTHTRTWWFRSGCASGGGGRLLGSLGCGSAGRIDGLASSAGVFVLLVVSVHGLLTTGDGVILLSGVSKLKEVLDPLAKLQVVLVFGLDQLLDIDVLYLMCFVQSTYIREAVTLRRKMCETISARP